MKAQELKAHVQAMLPDARMLPLERLREDLWLGCVDGRNPGCVAGAPGGNAGLLVLLLASLEEVRGRPFVQEEVRALLAQVRRHFGSFYLHSDRPALDALARVWPGATEAGLRKPPVAERQRLLSLLTRPEHVGCGHLRLMLQEPEAYGVRRDLTAWVIRAFFEALWDEGDDPGAAPAVGPLLFDLLPGEHREEAVVQLRTGAPELLVACPHYGARELFVHHPDAVAWVQAQQARMVVDEGWIPPSDHAHLVQVQDRKGQEQLQATLERLAPGLPVFEVEVLAAGNSGPGSGGQPRLRVVGKGVVAGQGRQVPAHLDSG